MVSKDRSDQIFGGIFLIGLALLFITGWWFPGILFVVGAASLGRTYAEGKPLTENTGAWITIIIGGVFMIGDVFSIFGGNWLAIILILLGGYLLFGVRLKSGASSAPSVEKPKNDMV